MSKEGKYLPVHLKTLRPDQALSFDLHIKLPGSQDHFVHYIRNSDILEKERIQRLKEKGLKKVYILDSDEESYLSYLDEGLDTLKSSQISTAEKAGMAADVLQTQAENAERSLETEKGFGRMQDQLGKVVGFFSADQGALKNVIEASGIAMDHSQHSANVSSLSLGIATLAGVTDSKELLDLGVAALLHDIGAKKLGFDSTASREQLSGDALKRYMSHPAEGVALLAGKPFVTPRVLALIADHEEVGDGRGYPEKKRLEKLSPLSQILNLANAFDKFCIVKNMSAKDAIDPFFEANIELFNLTHLNILSTVVTSK